jgi:ABC-2 type transport system permease protein
VTVEQQATGAAVGTRVGGRPSWATTLTSVTRLELSRARTVRVPLLFVASFQSIGILILLRGVADRSGSNAIVAGSTVLVAAFTALNLLAQRLGLLRSTGALERYAVLPVPGSAVVLAHALAFAVFTLPGSIVTAVAGVLIYGVPAKGLLLLLPVMVLATAMFAGAGALIGLWSPGAEIATVLGQLGMSAVIFIGVVPPARLPSEVRDVRRVLPPAQAVDALASGFAHHVAWGDVLVDLSSCAGWAVLLLALAGRRIAAVARA